MIARWLLLNEIQNSFTISSSHLEPDINHDQVGEEKANQVDKKVSINIMHHRHRKCDPGGISFKAAIDGIVDAGILQDDSSKEVEEIREKQEKIPAGKPEITVITIEIDMSKK